MAQTQNSYSVSVWQANTPAFRPKQNVGWTYQTLLQCFTLVAGVEIVAPDAASAAESAFDQTQNHDASWSTDGRRSTIVGDILIVEHTAYHEGLVIERTAYMVADVGLTTLQILTDELTTRQIGGA